MDNSTATRSVTVACPACQTLNRVDLARLEDGPRCGKCRQPLPFGQPFPASDETLERILSSAEVPVLVDFYADWCGPCRMIAPMLEQIARKHAGDALVLKLDTDRNPAMAMRYRVTGLPTVLGFAGGKEVGREIGAVPAQRLENLLRAA